MHSAASPSRLPPSTCKVLLVEDEVVVRVMLADELRQSGLQVFEAANADEAIERRERTILGREDSGAA
jgi:CheY-like chemotaxis protein